MLLCILFLYYYAYSIYLDLCRFLSHLCIQRVKILVVFFVAVLVDLPTQANALNGRQLTLDYILNIDI